MGMPIRMSQSPAERVANTILTFGKPYSILSIYDRPGEVNLRFECEDGIYKAVVSHLGVAWTVTRTEEWNPE